MKKRRPRQFVTKRFFEKPFFMHVFGVVVLVLVLFLVLDTTYSALTDQDMKQNEFRVPNFQLSIEEEFEPPKNFKPNVDYKKIVTIKNTGGMASFVRVLALPVLSQQDSEGVQLIPTVTNGGDELVEVDYNLVDWIDGGDGYFYYRKKLQSQESSSPLLKKVKLRANGTSEYSEVALNFEIKVEGIHVTKSGYRDAWWKGEIPISNPLLEVDNTLKVEAIGN